MDVKIVQSIVDKFELNLDNGLNLRSGKELMKHVQAEIKDIDTKNVLNFYGNSEIVTPTLPSIWFNLYEEELRYLIKRITYYYPTTHVIYYGDNADSFKSETVANFSYFTAKILYIPQLTDNTKSAHTISDIKLIMAALRSKSGCPWDKEQTFFSMRRPLIEESYEVIEAITKGLNEDIAEELGDLLLNIVFIAHLGEENGDFDLNSSINMLGQKLIRRHTHVFGDITAKTGDAALKNWEDVKKTEKNITDTDGAIFYNIPLAFPALTRAQKIQKRAAGIGFDWENVTGAIDKFHEEVAEFDEAIQKNYPQERVADEIGDLFFTLVNVCRFLHLDAEDIARNANDKFLNRFNKMAKYAKKLGKDISNSTLDELEEFWQAIK